MLTVARCWYELHGSELYKLSKFVVSPMGLSLTDGYYTCKNVVSAYVKIK